MNWTYFHVASALLALLGVVGAVGLAPHGFWWVLVGVCETLYYLAGLLPPPHGVLAWVYLAACGAVAVASILTLSKSMAPRGNAFSATVCPLVVLYACWAALRLGGY